MLVQQGLRKAPELMDKPLLPELGKNDSERAGFEFLSLVPALGRPFFMPPGTPPERAAAIRRAFEATMKDPGFLDEAKKGKLDVAPLSGDDAASDRDAQLLGVAGGARDREEGDGVMMLAQGAIDCDVHLSVPDTTVLLPFLDDYWRDQIVNRHIHKHVVPSAKLSAELSPLLPARLAAEERRSRQRSRSSAQACARRFRHALSRSATRCMARSRCSTRTWRRR